MYILLYIVSVLSLFQDVKADDCAAVPCQNDGVCAVNEGGGYTCTCSSHYTGVNCETAGDDFLYWTESFTGQSCPWDDSLTTCAKCRDGGIQCPYHTTPNVCVMNGQYSQHLFCCHSLGLYSTCDNQMWLYANGEEIGYLGDWSKSIFRQLQSDISVVAIKCLDVGGWGAILASFSDGTTSSTSSWNCSTVATEGWRETGFTGGSNWVTPFSLGKHPMAPWNTVAGMSNNAEWIWYPDQPQPGGNSDRRTVYCRTTLDWNTEKCVKEVDQEVGIMPTTTSTTTSTTTATPEATSSPNADTTADAASSTSETTPTSNTDEGNNNNGDGGTGDGSNSDSNNQGGADAQGQDESDGFPEVGTLDFQILAIAFGLVGLMVLLSCIAVIIIMRKPKKKKKEDEPEPNLQSLDSKPAPNIKAWR